MSDTIDLKNHPIVKALVAHQARLEMSDVTFSSRFIGISPASWSLIKTGTYAVQDPTPMLRRCEKAMRILNDEAEKAEVSGERRKVLELPHVQATLNAIKGCYGEPQNRLVLYLAPSGGGKTTMLRRVKEVYLSGAIAGEATETWRSSYFNATAEIAEWINLTEKFYNPRAAETAVMAALDRSPQILVIDEGHYLGPQALNLCKAILNKTQTRILILSIPQLWERMTEKSYEEALQLRRRTHAKIVVQEVTAEDARTFLAAKLPGYEQLGGDEKAVVAAACKSANNFGLYDTLDRICAEVGTELPGKTKCSLDLVASAIRRVEALRS